MASGSFVSIEFREPLIRLARTIVEWSPWYDGMMDPIRPPQSQSRPHLGPARSILRHPEGHSPLAAPIGTIATLAIFHSVSPRLRTTRYRLIWLVPSAIWVVIVPVCQAV